jgi:hypothetical protein
VHRADHVRLGRLAHRVLLVISQADHVFSCVSVVILEVSGQVLDIVDAASKLSFLTKVVDTDKKCFAAPCTRRILESVALRCAVAESLGSLGWRWGSGTCIKVRSSPGGILSVTVRTALLVLVLLLLLERSLSVV